MALNSTDIKEKALALGFDVVRMTHALPVDRAQADHFDHWLFLGYAGSMSYMHRHRDKRLDPALLHSATRSIVMVGLNYKPAGDLPDALPAHLGRVAHYAWYPDYHAFIRQRLHELLSWISENTQPAMQEKAKVCVDSVPVAERALAQRAGLGFIGKNHMVIHPDLGPELFLGEILLPLALEPDEPMQKDCAQCRLCLDACPTGALQEDGFFDAGRCINTLTIEHRGDIPENLACLIGDRVYGCDQCVKVCPYTLKAPAASHPDFQEIKDHKTLSLDAILAMDQADFDRTFSQTPIHRIGLSSLQRNARTIKEHRPSLNP